MERFTNKSPGALTMEQAIARHKKSIEEYKRQLRQARALAAQGRGEDTEIAHVALGELVVPRTLQSPEVIAALQRAATEQNIPLEMLRVGNAANRINPNTGQPEFGLGTWLSGMFGGNSAAAADSPTNGMTVDVPPLPESAAPYLPKGWDALRNPESRTLPKRAEMISALQNTNVQAGMDFINNREGGKPNLWNGGKTYDRFDDHPGNIFDMDRAAGDFQMKRDAFNDAVKKVGPMDYNTPDQRLAAVTHLDTIDGLAPLQNGDVDGFLDKASVTRGWASFPPNGHQSRGLTLDQARYLYYQHLINRRGW